MPKDVFLKFPAEKQEKILSVLEAEFKTKPFQKVNVKEIVEKSVLHAVVSNNILRTWKMRILPSLKKKRLTFTRYLWRSLPRTISS